jgi:hypothetical protein
MEGLLSLPLLIAKPDDSTVGQAFQPDDCKVRLESLTYDALAAMFEVISQTTNAAISNAANESQPQSRPVHCRRSAASMAPNVLAAMAWEIRSERSTLRTNSAPVANANELVFFRQPRPG